MCWCVTPEGEGRSDGLALPANGDLYVGGYTPDAIYRITSSGEVELFVFEPLADLLNRPTNLAFGDGVRFRWEQAESDPPAAFQPYECL